MSVRKEVLSALRNRAKEGIIPLSKRGGREAEEHLVVGRDEYEQARGAVLEHQLSRFYNVAIFGSARLDEDSKEFKFVSELAKSLVEARDVDIMTGGGPGIMKAAIIGAYQAIAEAQVNGKRLKSRRHGIRINDLPIEEKAGEHLSFSSTHNEFSTRLQEFIDRSQAAYNAPGGIGTLLEQLILVQSRQVGHLEPEYILMAHSFWEPVVESWNNAFYYNRIAQDETPLITEADLHIIRFSDNIPDIVDHISQGYDQWKTLREQVRVIE
ncbi:MAG: LOG family protein [Candidatus Levybacteria bacterium]|nr:LOG family protein [Candidatus Levybacteria bacterium]